MFKEIIKYVQDSKNEKGLVSNCIQADLQNNKYNSSEDKITFSCDVFFYDFEKGNGLGSHAGEQKCGGVYVSLPVLPPHLVSKCSNAFLATIFYSKFRKVCGNAVVFKRVIEDLNDLSKNGLKINVAGKEITVYFEFILVLGDHLGLNSSCGFVESFGANKYCRICNVPKKDCETKTKENLEMLRTREDYEKDMSKN